VQAYEVGEVPEPYRGEITALKAGVRAAEHFVLDGSLAQAADNLSKDEVLKAIPVCRVPHERTWIEVCHQDRLKFMQTPVKPGLIKPRRVGLLVEPASDMGEGFYDLTLVWDCPGAPMPINICAISAVADLSGENRAPPDMTIIDLALAGKKLGGENVAALPMLFTATRKYSGGSIRMIAEHDPMLAAKLLEQCIGDWGGEPWFWMSVLALLNARNGASVVAGEDRSRLNRARAKAGKKPLAAFHVLTVRLSKAERAAMREGHEERRELRAHVVRGHFKLRRSGMYWWRPFVRGDLDKGFAAKRYDFKGAPRR
jgi:hypothetical protein